uniref:Coenzyme Q7, hydroxylase n=1 Tax=Gallus gallus TaxID=9031 RepID=A0A8V0ZMX2_CHICK
MAAAGALAPALRCSLGRHRALSRAAGRRGRWPFLAEGASLRPCSTRAALDGINKAVVDRIIRVDHAGEYGANRIYAGQMAVLGRSAAGPLIQGLEVLYLERRVQWLAQWRWKRAYQTTITTRSEL